MPSLGVIILAAGGSTRMGQAKQLLKVDGQTLIRKIILTAKSTDPEFILVVLGHESESIKSEISNLNVEIVQNQDWEKGMASSLRLALQYLQKKIASPKSVLLLLCDQPLISTDYLKQLIESYQKNNKPAAASGYNDIQGVPAIFDFEILVQFSENRGDFGARHLLKKLAKENQLIVLPFPEGAIDLDTPEDYKQFLK